MRPITTRTAENWLHRCGFTYGIVARKGFYADGHEDLRVVEYRQKVFLPIFLLAISSSKIWFRNGRTYESIYSLEPEDLKLKEDRGEVHTRPLNSSERKIVEQCSDEAKITMEKLSNVAV
jgi:hypothetical protein